MADLGWPELTIIAIAVVVLFGWKRMPDMARSLGRSARIFKSEVDQMKTSPDAPDIHDVHDVHPVPTVPRTSGDEAHEAHDAVVRADDRVAQAEAEVARLRAELLRRRHDSGSH